MVSIGESALDIPPPLRANASSFERHDVYYLETIVFRVEDTLFRVPRRGFELESPVFASMFSLPTGNHSPEGQDDNSPIMLQGMEKKDFQSLLELMYPMGPNLPVLGHEDLVGVLHLSTMWEFAKIRDYVIGIMDEQMDAVERVILAKKERVSAWLLTGYETLVGGPESLTIDRVKKLDWETIARLFAIQHRLLVQGQITVPCPECSLRSCQSDSPGGNQRPGAEVMLEEEFQDELNHIREEEYAKGWKVRPPPAVEDQVTWEEQTVSLDCLLPPPCQDDILPDDHLLVPTFTSNQGFDNPDESWVPSFQVVSESALAGSGKGKKKKGKKL